MGRVYIFPARRLGEGKTRTCKNCGKEFEPTGRMQKFCNVKCHNDWWHAEERRRMSGSRDGRVMP
jgi:hypothetical protein